MVTVKTEGGTRKVTRDCQHHHHGLCVGRVENYTTREMIPCECKCHALVPSHDG